LAAIKLIGFLRESYKFHVSSEDLIIYKVTFSSTFCIIEILCSSEFWMLSKISTISTYEITILRVFLVSFP
jgi:hypothetical protein